MTDETQEAGRDEARDEMRAEVARAIAEGRDVQQRVRAITLKALTARELDQAALAEVTRDVMRAVREAAEAAGHLAPAPGITHPVREALDGLDEALAHAAQALKLSLEEAAGRAQAFRHEDLARARADLAMLERLYLDTLRETARSARGTTAAMLEDLARHARVSGTVVGRQLERASPLASSLAQAGRAGFGAGLSAAAASGALVARVASGVLAGIADALEGKRKGAPH